MAMPGEESTFEDEMEGLLESQEAGNRGEQQPQQNNQQPVPQQGGQPVPGGNEPQWDGNQFTLKYRGNPYVPKSRDDLINLAQRGFSYNQELERFNKERTGFQTTIKDLEGRVSKYDEFDKILKANPALADQIVNMFQQVQSGGQFSQPGQQGGGMDMRLVNDLMNRISALETSSTEYENQRYDNILQQSIQELRTNHPEHNWDQDEGNGNLEKQILQFALDNNITNLEHAYRAMMWDSNNANAKGEALKKAAAARQQATRSGIVQNGGGGGPQPGPAYQHGDSYNDLGRKMLAEMK